MSINTILTDTFRNAKSFTLQDAYSAVQEVQPETKPHSVRARIYEGLKANMYLRLANGVYAVTYKVNGQNKTCILVQGDGRNLSFLKDSSVDAIITDHPYNISGQLKGGNRDFASYDLFQYTEKDFMEKYRVLKPGAFLVEFIPEESSENFSYLTALKHMAMKAGFSYYAKVPWKKGAFVANTGRKSKNSEDIIFFTKGKSRSLRPDVKKDKADPSTKHYMSGAAGMLPTAFDFQPPSRADRIHQAEKPVELLEAILEYVTLEGEWVLDQFAGSGATGEAALRKGRNSMLIEKDGVTAQKIVSRLSMEAVL